MPTANKTQRMITEMYASMNKVLGIVDTHERLKIDVTKLNKVIFENGLNSQVKELYENMLEQKENKKTETREMLKGNLALRNLMLGTLASLILNILIELFKHP